MMNKTINKITFIVYALAMATLYLDLCVWRPN